jgi:2-dehydropantoate 2-reductase
MRILVIGGGAIGGITAAGLDADVVVLDANAEHVAAMRSPGLVINDAKPVPLEAVTADPEGEFDFALIAIKAPLHEAVIPGLAARGGIGAFCTLGNGLIQDRIEGMVGRGNLLAALVEWGGTNAGPGHLVRDSEGGYVVGELDGSITDRAEALVAALQPIGASRVTDNVRGMIWTKLLINSTFTGLSAITGLRYGPASDVDYDVTSALWEEGVAVGDAQGLELQVIHGIEPHHFDAAALAGMMEGSANVKPSMLQDLEAGRLTEVDVVNGGVAARGRECGLPTPCNDKVVELVHAIERGELSPDPRLVRYVSEAQTISATDS